MSHNKPRLNSCQFYNNCRTIYRAFRSETFIFAIVSILIALPEISLAQEKCHTLFSEYAQKPEITDMKSFGSAMTKNMLLSPEQADLFETYRQMYFGDPNTSVSGHGLKSVTYILKKHPELEKPHFREFTISSVEKVYETPDSLYKYVKSQTTTAGQIRNNLFQIEANLGFWKKLLDYKDPEIPQALLDLQKKMGKDSPQELKDQYRKSKTEFETATKQRFETYLNRMISRKNRELLADLKNENTTYYQKTKALFDTLRYIQEWMDKKGRNTQTIRQALVDLIYTIGYNNQSTQSLLKSSNAIDKIQGLNQLWNEADAITEELKYPGHFAELKSKLRIDYPTGLSKNEDPTQIIQNLEADVLASRFTTKPTDTIRVRSLSIQESPFRSCLGADCSTRTYFDKALDPNYIYFTMTDKENHSSGHATLVLGTAMNSTTNQAEKVAFLDKLQNIPTQKIDAFLQAVSESLATKGYKLAIPTYLGKDIPGHGGLSNMDVITDFVQGQIMPRLNNTLAQFTPNAHQYNFKNVYSRAVQKLEVRPFVASKQDSNTEIRLGEENKPYQASANLDKNKLVQDFLKLKDSKNPVDIEKFIASVNIVTMLEKLGLYTKTMFSKDLVNIAESEVIEYNIRKQAAYTQAYIEQSTHVFFKWLVRQSEFSQTQIASEIASFKTANSPVKKYLSEQLNLFAAVKDNNFFLVHFLIKKMNFDVNVKNNTADTALVLAASNGHKEIVELLLNHPSVDVSAKNIFGLTALNVAINNGHKEIVELLLKHPSIDVNAKNIYSQTALNVAVDYGHKEIVELLLKHPSIDVNTKTYDGDTALSLAAKNGHKEILELLLKHPEIDVNVKNNHANTALVSAASHGRKEIIELLLKHPSINVNAKNNNGLTTLMYEVCNGHKEIVELLLKHPEIDVNVKNNIEDTALVMAARARNGLKEIVVLLLKHPNIDVNAKNYKGFTALFEAVSYGHKEIVELLLKHPEIDVNAETKLRFTALSYAVSYGPGNDIVELLKAHGAK